MVNDGSSLVNGNGKQCGIPYGSHSRSAASNFQLGTMTPSSVSETVGPGKAQETMDDIATIGRWKQ